MSTGKGNSSKSGGRSGGGSSSRGSNSQQAPLAGPSAGASENRQNIPSIRQALPGVMSGESDLPTHPPLPPSYLARADPGAVYVVGSQLPPIPPGGLNTQVGQAWRERTQPTLVERVDYGGEPSERQNLPIGAGQQGQSQIGYENQSNQNVDPPLWQFVEVNPGLPTPLQPAEQPAQSDCTACEKRGKKLPNPCSRRQPACHQCRTSKIKCIYPKESSNSDVVGRGDGSRPGGGNGGPAIRAKDLLQAYPFSTYRYAT